MKALVLASSSTYRQTILQKLQIPFSCHAAGVDESPLPGESPDELVLRLAVAKARAIAHKHPHHLIIGSDQAATCGPDVLGKPGTLTNATKQLKAQSGQKVSFYTGLCLLDSSSGNLKTALDICHVHFKTLTDLHIQRYLDKEQPFDCAGSFKSEGYGITLFERIEGDDPNALIGLPLIKLVALLADFGIDLP